jgi:hypothetical protein
MVRQLAEAQISPAFDRTSELLITPAHPEREAPAAGAGLPSSSWSSPSLSSPGNGAWPGEAGASRPAVATLEIIQQTWAEILRIDAVGPDDDFFELGGNSLIVANALAQLGARVGLELPMRTLFEAPTPAEMVEVIDELRAEQPVHAIEGMTPFLARWVILLQRHGTKRPVFLYPGGVGGIWIMTRDAQVAALVGRDHPFYGFRRDKPHIDPARENWHQAMAAAYIEQMRNIQGGGPYLIYAICGGGPLAWETIKQLQAAGEEIAGVLFYEVPLRADFATRAPEPSSSRAAVLRPFRTYIPEPLPIDVTMLMCDGWQAKGESAGFEQIVRGNLETVLMPGDSAGPHNPYEGRESMVAEHVRNWIAQSEARLERG